MLVFMLNFHKMKTLKNFLLSPEFEGKDFVEGKPIWWCMGCKNGL